MIHIYIIDLRYVTALDIITCNGTTLLLTSQLVEVFTNPT